MLKKLSLLLAAITVTLLFHSAAYSQNMTIEKGLLWLSSNQNSDGSWGGASPSINSQFDTTFQVINTLSAINNSLPTYNSGVQWLMSQSITYTESLASRIIIFSYNGSDATSDISALISYQNADGGWGEESDIFKITNNLDTIRTLQALRAANYPDQNIIYSAFSNLLSAQNPDGGFGFFKGDPSNVYMAAIMLYTISQYKSIYNLQTPISNAASYLLAHQNPDGSFGPSTGSGQSTVYETALSLIALIESGQGSALPLQNAINYLTVTQLPNGSWEDDPYSTALALRALAHVKPNLSISSTDITFSTPTAGGTVTITANIKNAGTTQADNILSNSVMENNRKKSS